MFISFLQHPFFSNRAFQFTRSKRSKKWIARFVKKYNINIEEAEHPIDQYHSIHDLFTRKLKDGSRPIEEGEKTIISPVDAFIESSGKVSSDETFTVKGQDYSIVELLGSMERANRYKNGTYVVLYLSPTDYHRIHTPFDGKVLTHAALGGVSYPVNQWGLLYGDAPLSKNYRRLTELETNYGRMTMVKVGALFVNTIDLLTEEKDWKKGEEVAMFSFGSTVVLFFERDKVKLTKQQGTSIKVGESIAEWV